MKKLTKKDFDIQYPNDNVCLDKIFSVRFGHLKDCPHCNKPAQFKRITTRSEVKITQRKGYQCSHCRYQIYPLANTIFENTTTPLTSWFYALYLLTTTRNGLAAKEIERQVDVCYKTALRMAHQLKKLMANHPQPVLSGVVMADEMIPSMKSKNMHSAQRNIARESGFTNKQMIFGIMQSNGQIIVEHVKYNDWETMRQILAERVHPDSILITDKGNCYKDLEKYGLNFKQHIKVNHYIGEYVNEGYSTNRLEGFWSQLRRMIHGTHIKVSPMHLQKYIDECATRYMLRNEGGNMFDIILRQVA